MDRRVTGAAITGAEIGAENKAALEIINVLRLNIFTIASYTGPNRAQHPLFYKVMATKIPVIRCGSAFVS